MLEFNAPRSSLLETLPENHDSAGFGVIGIDGAARVRVYNHFEARLAGLSVERTLGKHLFEEVAPCMNNFMVAQRFVDAEELDEQIDFVFTLKMAPRRVRLRLLASTCSPLRFILVQPQ